MFTNKTILVTGGTGSWGNELVSQLLEKNPKEIRIFSRNETSQVLTKQKFENDPRLTFLIGDVRDKEAVMEAAQKVDYIFHLAALKHVPVCEHQPLEALKTNVMGTQNIIDAAIENEVEKVINISTDKAANPSNFYGFTKAMGEKLIINANVLTDKTKFVCVRGGNVLGTNGSVIHVFKHGIKEKSKIGITDKNMTRFFLTIKDAIKLLFKATYESHGGEIFVMKMPTCKIMDLAQVLIDRYSPDQEVTVEELGIRPGEKLHELLLTEFESHNTIVYDNEYFVILPTIHIEGLTEFYKDFPQVDLDTYSSSDNIINYDQIKSMLKDGGFLE
ncbi:MULTISPECIES: SDR family NAD(P)-dependent oxidoreductase [Rossellomorea]|uniref:NAD-dependent epimerase/dehydratase family protein n=1 Tax=Rossellomorea marisflavi TaxID=189381 RepID=A0A0J5SNJ6_9BACI|nr:SDR family NAD(P)-dependent oxidoreductase [Rossellomorea marisflavi]KQU60287.1 UDP-N-acetylglucosamine 4,6-dehydratase [Bacillus sp. Leaf406]KMK96431.1 UDP-N-acetylglucosamine 4,6-dehydratase [Rossellomorea marisflavi]KML06530.1 UDP-N-acetylglucosamine 4,6-dehydratase [Rossellomorea marisflavi]KML32915.1 UDP-N-acetylglucosamine 4,6-dehydratase [Rossellomorea marisflavi]KZE49900.1 UDP-N-acetylglucosamine 4,6-dehydratase [Rossellomorea marisflavi]